MGRLLESLSMGISGSKNRESCVSMRELAISGQMFIDFLGFPDNLRLVGLISGISSGSSAQAVPVAID